MIDTVIRMKQRNSLCILIIVMKNVMARKLCPCSRYAQQTEYNISLKKEISVARKMRMKMKRESQKTIKIDFVVALNICRM